MSGPDRFALLWADVQTLLGSYGFELPADERAAGKARAAAMFAMHDVTEAWEGRGVASPNLGEES